MQDTTQRSSAAKGNSASVLTHRVEKWSDFVRIIDEWKSVRNWCFRGQGDASWPLKPSLSRHIEVSKVAPEAWIEQERRIRRIFERKSHLYMTETPQLEE